MKYITNIIICQACRNEVKRKKEGVIEDRKPVRESQPELVKQEGEAVLKPTFSINKILVVDDDRDLARVIRGHLEKEGYEVAIANSGIEAIKKAIELKPHLITLDIFMPSMDGFTVAELLKQNPNTKDIPILHVWN